MTLSRRLVAALPVLLALWPATASAQAALEGQTATPPDRIDLRVRQGLDEPEYEDCSDEQEAAELSGEIIVCRRKTGDENRLFDKEAALERHAARTQGQKPVDVFGIPNHGVVVGRGCFIPPCPPPMPVLIDVEALPEAPPGSDADRIARGLAPRGRDVAAVPTGPQVVSEAQLQANADQLGLPPPPRAEGEAGVNPSGSASPAPGPQG